MSPWLPTVRLRPLMVLSIVLHVGMLLYGEYQDAHFAVKYTDIDYVVFTDAARYVHNKQSPYLRETYRYTPLLAIVLTPNIWLHPAFGKCLFVLGDLVAGWFVHAILRLRGMEEDRACGYAAIWLLNPMVANISTRGSAESLMAALVLGTFWCLFSGRFWVACVLYGTSVHLKIYPILYAIPILVLLDARFTWTDEWQMRFLWEKLIYCLDALGLVNLQSVDAFKTNGEGVFWIRERDDQTPAPNSNTRLGLKERIQALPPQIMALFNPARICFGLASGSVFFLLTGLMYKSYGMAFLDESLLYHLTRQDHRHNFSPWFYYMYLTFSSPATLSTVSDSSHLLGLVTFVPQLLVCTILGLVFGKDIFFAAFIQTWAFVMLNKVCTSQYFMWYICFFPLILPSTEISFRYKGLLMACGWVLGQASWLYEAYYLEFQAQNTFYGIWLASLAFYLINAWIGVEFIQGHDFENVFGVAGHVRHIWMSKRRR